jgi:hypothetical protein
MVISCWNRSIVRPDHIEATATTRYAMSKDTVDIGALGENVENFKVTLHRSEGDLSDVWTRIEYKAYEPSGIKVTLLHQEFLRIFNLRSMLSSDTGDLHMTCHAPTDFPIWFWGVRGMKASGDKLEIDLSGYDLGGSEGPLAVNEEVTILAYLTRGQLSSRRRSAVKRWDGAITYSIDLDKVEDEKEETIEWQDESQATILRMQHDYEEARVGGNKVLLQIARPAMVRSLKTDGSQSLKSIIEGATSDLKDICLMLSLAFRQKIQWYEIIVETYKSQERPRLIPRAKRRSAVPDHHYSEREDPLIDHRDLVQGGFKTLLDMFQSCEHREMLRRAIAFQVSSRNNDGGLESSYILCYSALEAIVSEAALRSDTLSRFRPAQWKNLRRLLEKTVGEFGGSHGLNTDLIEAMRNRLPVLARPAFSEELFRITRSLGVKVDDLWPEPIGFERGLRQALKIRNSLVHRAVIVNPSAMYENLVRLRSLTERLILKLIGWPNEKVWVWADQALKWVNKKP